MKDKKLKFLILNCSFVFCVLGFALTCFAQDGKKLEELKGQYFKEAKFTEFVNYLKGVAEKDKSLEAEANYYIALARYHQLKYLEEKQSWDEYFNEGNTYRDEMTAGAQKAIDETKANDALNVKAHLVLWQFHHDQQDVFAQDALSNLMNSTLEYAKATKDLETIKEVADKLSSYGEKGKSRQLYKIYAQELLSSETKDGELKRIADAFYKEENTELAETIYDAYIERIAKEDKEKLMPVLIGIAKSFAYKDEGPNDPPYAEKIFNKIEELGGKESFDEALIYLRAFNLEKSKEYAKAKDSYLELIKRYPDSDQANEANFKLGIIFTYILRDAKSGKAYFQELAQKKAASAYVISGLYQLGLLSQWAQDSGAAQAHYNELIEMAKSDFPDKVAQARERLKEIQDSKLIEYNLKTFLDASLKEEYTALDSAKSNLRSHPYIAKKDAQVQITSGIQSAQSGCMQVEVQFLWSGDLGENAPGPNQPAFKTTYKSPGTKMVNLVVVSPTGIIDRNIDLLDVR